MMSLAVTLILSVVVPKLLGLVCGACFQAALPRLANHRTADAVSNVPAFGTGWADTLRAAARERPLTEFERRLLLSTDLAPRNGTTSAASLPAANAPVSPAPLAAPFAAPLAAH